jgi:DNA topoisomerase III
MARGGLVEIVDATFEKEGKQIAFKKVYLTRFGREGGAVEAVKIPVEFAVPEFNYPPRRGKRPSKRRKPKAAVPLSVQPADTQTVARAEAALKSWRLAEAKRREVPAFRILSDKALRAIAERHPQSESELLEISGVGAKIVTNYANAIFRILDSA